MTDPQRPEAPSEPARATTTASVFPGFAALDDDVHDIVTRLAEHRRANGLSQTVIATRMGTSQSAVARLEAGRGDLRLSTLQRYVQALGHTMHFGVVPSADEGQHP